MKTVTGHLENFCDRYLYLIGDDGKQIYLTADEFFKEFIGKEITLIVQEK